MFKSSIRRKHIYILQHWSLFTLTTLKKFLLLTLLSKSVWFMSYFMTEYQQIIDTEWDSNMIISNMQKRIGLL
jgi:hypothetical protein